MNILIHGSVGVFGSIILGDPLFFIGSILPDISLIKNEVSLKLKNQKFNMEKVDSISYIAYQSTHSLFFAGLCTIFAFHLGAGVCTHQILDWFSHSGRFSTKIFFPFSKISIEKLFK